MKKLLIGLAAVTMLAGAQAALAAPNGPEMCPVTVAVDGGFKDNVIFNVVDQDGFSYSSAPIRGGDVNQISVPCGSQIEIGATPFAPGNNALTPKAVTHHYVGEYVFNGNPARTSTNITVVFPNDFHPAN